MPIEENGFHWQCSGLFGISRFDENRIPIHLKAYRLRFVQPVLFLEFLTLNGTFKECKDMEGQESGMKAR